MTASTVSPVASTVSASRRCFSSGGSGRIDPGARGNGKRKCCVACFQRQPGERRQRRAALRVEEGGARRNEAMLEEMAERRIAGEHPALAPPFEHHHLSVVLTIEVVAADLVSIWLTASDTPPSDSQSRKVKPDSGSGRPATR